MVKISDYATVIKGKTISGALFCAPMAGVTHCALRRLIAEFGGYGALYTEMLSGAALCAENLALSTFTKRRREEGIVFYQVRLSGEEDMNRMIDKLSTIEPYGIDINLGCPAPMIRKYGGGVSLFEDYERLKVVLNTMRARWKGILTVKCRLGKPSLYWQEPFLARLKLFESIGIDAVTVHPRFSDEKLKRRARWELFPWITSNTLLPVIANGDIARADSVAELLCTSGCKGVMIGRMAAVKPWIFSEITMGHKTVDYCATWLKLFDYVCEDFIPGKAIGRIKEFSAYYARNFIYGHQFYKGVQGAHDLETLKARAIKFLSENPAVEKEPSVMGI